MVLKLFLKSPCLGWVVFKKKKNHWRMLGLKLAAFRTSHASSFWNNKVYQVEIWGIKKRNCLQQQRNGWIFKSDTNFNIL